MNTCTNLRSSVVALTVLLAIDGTSLHAQQPLEQFVQAMAQGRTSEMRSIVLLNEQELSNDFFEVLRLTAADFGVDREKDTNYLVVAAALAKTFAVTSGSTLSRAVGDGSTSQRGSARQFYSDASLADFLEEAVADVRRGLGFRVASELTSIVEAYDRSRLPDPVRRFQEELEILRAQQASRDAAERERKQKLEAEQRARERQKLIASLVAKRDLIRLRQMWNENRSVVQWDVFDALVAAKDPSWISDMTKAWLERLGDVNEGSRAEAASALVRIGTPGVPIMLERMKDNRTFDLNLAIARVLEQLKYLPDAGEQAAYVMLVRRDVSELVKFGGQAHPAIVAALQSANDNVRFDALTVIRQIGSEDDVLAIRPLLDASAAEVRQAARTAVWSLSSSPLGLLRAAWWLSPWGFALFAASLLSTTWWGPRLFRKIRRRWSDQVIATHRRTIGREETINATLALMQGKRRPLPDELIVDLERAAAAGRPEANILLAWNAIQRHDHKKAAALLAELWNACLAGDDLLWVARAVCSIEVFSSSPTISEARRPFDEVSRCPHKYILAPLLSSAKYEPNLLKKALTKLGKLEPLPASQKMELQDRFQDHPETIVVVAYDEIRMRQFSSAAKAVLILADRVLTDHELPPSIADEAIDRMGVHTNGSEEFRKAFLALRLNHLTVRRLLTGSRDTKVCLLGALAEVAASGPLPAASRAALERHASERPEVLAALAKDSAQSGRWDMATQNLSELANRLSGNETIPGWLPDVVLGMEFGGPQELKATIDRIRADHYVRELIFGVNHQTAKPLRNVLAALQTLDPLSVENRQQLERHAGTRPYLLLVLANDDFRTEQPTLVAERMTLLARQIVDQDGVPQWVRDEATNELKNAEGRFETVKKQVHLLKFAALVRSLLARETPPGELNTALAAGEQELQKFGVPLPDPIRSAIESGSAQRPELAILLASDDFLRKAEAGGLERLMQLLKTLNDAHRVSSAAIAAWLDHVERASGDVQAALRKAAEAGSDDAWASLALVVLQRGAANATR